MKRYIDIDNNFIEVSDPKTGFYMRTGVINNNIDSGIDPYMRNFPNLLDVGVMGRCINGEKGLCDVQCYQNGPNLKKSNMPLADFQTIVEQSRGKVFSIALGGRGDVDQHEDFEGLLKVCVDNDIVPNFTTSGLGLTQEKINIIKEYCGAVAVSWYRRPHTIKAIENLIEANICTNIHYVLGNDSIDEAIERLENNSFPKGINAVIFLLHKPIGLGQESNVLDVKDPKVKKFYSLIDKVKVDHKIGFDSCNSTAIVNFSENIDTDSIDACESGRFSAYIDAEMNMMPCSFCNQDSSYFINLNDHTLTEAWNSDVFESFRKSTKESCPSCEDRLNCKGGCPIVRSIVLCDRPTKILI